MAAIISIDEPRPRGTILGERLDRRRVSEAEHFFRCEACGGPSMASVTFSILMPRSSEIAWPPVSNLEAAAQTVDDEGGESFAFDVFRDNHPAAIEVPAEVVETAVKATASFLAELKWQEDEKLRIARETEDAEWRAAFIPHAIILGERKIPTSITMCVISGGPERWLKIELDISKSSNTFVQQAIAALPSKLHLGKDGRLSVPFFGYALGFIVNYSPDQAVRYDLKGNAVENLSKAFRLGRATFSLKGGTQIGNIGRRLEVVEISTT